MSDILINPGEDVFEIHPATPHFMRIASELGSTIVNESMRVPEILDQGRSSAGKDGIMLSHSEAAALAYLSRNRQRQIEGSADA